MACHNVTSLKRRRERRERVVHRQGTAERKDKNYDSPGRPFIAVPNPFSSPEAGSEGLLRNGVEGVASDRWEEPVARSCGAEVGVRGFLRARNCFSNILIS